MPKDCAITVSHCADAATLQQSKNPQATMKQGHGPSEQGHGPGRWLHPTVAAPVLVPHPPAALLISVSHNASLKNGNASCFLDEMLPHPCGRARGWSRARMWSASGLLIVLVVFFSTSANEPLYENCASFLFVRGFPASSLNTCMTKHHSAQDATMAACAGCYMRDGTRCAMATTQLMMVATMKHE